MAQPTFDHKGTPITFTDRGDFTAEDCNGKFIRAASLDAMKKKLDSTALAKFKPFRALRLSYYVEGYKNGEGLDEVNITEIEKGGRGDRTSYCFIGESRSRKAWNNRVREYTLHPDTPECRAAYHTYMNLMVKNNDLRNKMAAEEKAMQAAIPVIKASDYMGKKK